MQHFGRKVLALTCIISYNALLWYSISNNNSGNPKSCIYTVFEWSLIGNSEQIIFEVCVTKCMRMACGQLNGAFYLVSMPLWHWGVAIFLTAVKEFYVVCLKHITKVTGMICFVTLDCMMNRFVQLE